MHHIRRGVILRLKLSHLGSLRPFGSVFFIEHHAVTFGQGFESTPLDGAVMDENVMPAVTFDESIALAVIEPFYSTFRHVSFPFLVGSVGSVWFLLTGTLLWGNFGTVSHCGERPILDAAQNTEPISLLLTLVHRGQKASPFLAGTEETCPRPSLFSEDGPPGAHPPAPQVPFEAIESP